MKTIIYIVILILFFSCLPKEEVKKPANLIPKNKMIDLLVDMNIAKGTRNIKNKKQKKNLNYMSYVYDKHQIDSSQFKESNAYYIYNNVIYQSIYNEVHRRIKDSLNKYEIPIKIADSIKKAKQDSIQELKVEKSKVKKE